MHKNRIKSRIIYVFLFFLMLLSACSRSKERQGIGETSGISSKSVDDPEAEPVKIGVLIYKFEDEFMTLYRNELKKYLSEKYDVTVKVLDAEGDENRQIEQIDQMIESGYDAIIVNLIQSSAAEAITNRCAKAFVPVVYINRQPEDAEILRWSDENIPAAYVGADSAQAGHYQGEIILETADRGDLNGDGIISYVMIQGDPGHEAAKYRTEYAIKALEEEGFQTRRLFQSYGNWERKNGGQLMASALELYGESPHHIRSGESGESPHHIRSGESGDQIEVVFCNNDAMANGAKEVIESAGRKVGQDIYLVGVDALEETVGYVKAGQMTGTVLNDYVGQSHLAADLAVKMIEGGKTDTKYLVDSIKITMSGEIEAVIEP